MVKCLVNHGIPIDQVDRNGKTLCTRTMERLAENSHGQHDKIIELVKGFKTIGANPNHRNADGKTLLQSLFPAECATKFHTMCYTENQCASMTKLIDCLFELGSNLYVDPEALASATDTNRIKESFSYLGTNKLDDIVNTMPKIVHHLKQKAKLQTELKDIKNGMLALACATHRRCGTPSPAKVFDAAILKEIQQGLKNNALLESQPAKAPDAN